MTVVAADASSYSLGVVLSQIQSDGTSRPVACALQALTSAEEHYAQIEKESLTILHGPVNVFLIFDRQVIPCTNRP